MRRFNHDAVTENINRICEDHEESGVHEEVTQTQVSDGQVSNHGSPQNHIDQPPIRRSARLRTVPPRLQDYYCQSLMEDKVHMRTSPHAIHKFISYDNLPSAHRSYISSITSTHEPKSYKEAVQISPSFHPKGGSFGIGSLRSEIRKARSQVFLSFSVAMDETQAVSCPVLCNSSSFL
nr:Retrovirus-related Pol polyprotein from transposon TNT 1-94 [Ipomoea batatas]